jgi:hypothetical protein
MSLVRRPGDHQAYICYVKSRLLSFGWYIINEKLKIHLSPVKDYFNIVKYRKDVNFKPDYRQASICVNPNIAVRNVTGTHVDNKSKVNNKT